MTDKLKYGARFRSLTEAQRSDVLAALCEFSPFPGNDVGGFWDALSAILSNRDDSADKKALPSQTKAPWDNVCKVTGKALPSIPTCKPGLQVQNEPEHKQFADANCGECGGSGRIETSDDIYAGGGRDEIYAGWRWCDCAVANLKNALLTREQPKCTRESDCAKPNGHSEHCMRANGELILRRKPDPAIIHAAEGVTLEPGEYESADNGPPMRFTITAPVAALHDGTQWVFNGGYPLGFMWAARRVETRPWDEGGRDEYFSKLPGDARLVAGLDPEPAQPTGEAPRCELCGAEIRKRQVVGSYACEHCKRIVCGNCCNALTERGSPIKCSDCMANGTIIICAAAGAMLMPGEYETLRGERFSITETRYASFDNNRWFFYIASINELHDAVRRVEAKAQPDARCANCDGSGKAWDDSRCHVCNGTGNPVVKPVGPSSTDAKCARCGGSGSVYLSTPQCISGTSCPDCKGTGRARVAAGSDPLGICEPEECHKYQSKLIAENSALRERLEALESETMTLTSERDTARMTQHELRERLQAAERERDKWLKAFENLTGDLVDANARAEQAEQELNDQRKRYLDLQRRFERHALDALGEHGGECLKQIQLYREDKEKAERECAKLRQESATRLEIANDVLKREREHLAKLTTFEREEAAWDALNEYVDANPVRLSLTVDAQNWIFETPNGVAHYKSERVDALEAAVVWCELEANRIAAAERRARKANGRL